MQDQSSSQYAQLHQQRFPPPPSHHHQQAHQPHQPAGQCLADDARSCSSDCSQHRRSAAPRSQQQQQLMYCGSSTADSDAGQTDVDAYVPFCTDAILDLGPRLSFSTNSEALVLALALSFKSL